MTNFTKTYPIKGITVDMFGGNYYECFKYVLRSIGKMVAEHNRDEYVAWRIKSKDMDFYARGMNHIDRQKFCHDWLTDHGYLR